MRTGQSCNRLPVQFTGGMGLFDDFFKGWLEGPSSGFESREFPFLSASNALLVDVKETDDSIQIVAEMPGLKKDDINVVIQDNYLTISGERQSDHEEKTGGFLRREISKGTFKRAFQLPDSALGTEVKADYKDGLLKLVIPKKEESKPKKVEVKIS